MRRVGAGGAVAQVVIADDQVVIVVGLDEARGFRDADDAVNDVRAELALDGAADFA